MNPIASQTVPQITRDGGFNGALPKGVAPISTASSPAQAADGPVLMASAVAQPDAMGDAARTARKEVASAVASRRSELSGEKKIETYAESPETGARPAAPLRSFAQIPTQMIQEINRMREDFASTRARGVEGRPDPTPMPARPEAIGTPTAA